MKKMSHFIAGAVFGVAVSIGSVAVASNTDLVAKIFETKVVVDGKEMKLSDKPVNINNRVYLPLRTIGENLGYTVNAQQGRIDLVTSGSTPSSNTQSSQSNSQSSEVNYIKNLRDIISTDGKMDANKLKLAIAANEVTANSQDEDTGDSLFQMVIKENNYVVYQVLLANGLKPDSKNKKGETPLHTAVIENNRFYYGELINHFNLKKQYKDNSGKYPIDYVEQYSSFHNSLLFVDKVE